MQRLGGKVQLPQDTGDFRFMSRRSLDALLQLREQDKRPRDDQQGRQKRGAKAAGSVSVTISIGVAQRQAAQLTTEAELKAADQALYSAKGAGRNRVVAYGQVRRGAVRVAAVEA